MLLSVYSIYDSKIESYGTPFFMRHKGAAIRAFSDLVKDRESQLSKYPADFTLFELGSFDDTNAVFILHKTPVSLGVATEYLNSVADDVKRV